MAAVITNSDNTAITTAETTPEDDGICSVRTNTTVNNNACVCEFTTKKLIPVHLLNQLIYLFTMIIKAMLSPQGDALKNTKQTGTKHNIQVACFEDWQCFMLNVLVCVKMLL